MARRFNRSHLITILSAAILVGTEILGAALAFGWAMGSLFNLSGIADDVVIAICLAIGVYAIWRFVKGAVAIEPVTDSV